MDTYYAWSNFDVERNEWGQPKKTIKVGEEVTQEALGVSDLDWQEYIDLGVVRTQPYPDIPYQTAPTEYFKHLINRMTQGTLDTQGMQELEKYQMVTRNVAAETADVNVGASRELSGDSGDGSDGSGDGGGSSGFVLP
jgi:hypothetical protein